MQLVLAGASSTTGATRILYSPLHGTRAEKEAVNAPDAAARKRSIESSNKLMEILLKAHGPAKYIDRSKTEITGKDGADLIPARTEDGMRNMPADRLRETFSRFAAAKPGLPSIQ